MTDLRALLAPIKKRVDAYRDHGTPGLHAPQDRAKLFAAIEAVEALAEEWRYKGEFGWGAWQEGQGPDPEGAALDHASSAIRAALAAALGSDTTNQEGTQ